MTQDPFETKELSRAQLRRRDDIIQAALEAFDRDGFDAAKISDIADRAGVAKGTMYLYFGSKAELLKGVLVYSILPSLQRITEATVSHTGSAPDLLSLQFKMIAAQMASPGMKTLLRYMISGGQKQQDIIDFYYENVVQKGSALIRSTLEYGVERGEFRADVIDISPRVLVGTHVNIAIWNILFHDRDALDIDKFVDDHLALMLNGLLPKP
ncbi:TetR/AcrR family transcriptional regulator [Pacificibacter sp. AS14]|uniref:TetR/AcrR family transcriptional regulator n=1 Tax=Pacificibacter sp. AS14 TaxID=3135785 RepID=UPI00317A7916